MKRALGENVDIRPLFGAFPSGDFDCSGRVRDRSGDLGTGNSVWTAGRAGDLCNGRGGNVFWAAGWAEDSIGSESSCSGEELSEEATELLQSESGEVLLLNEEDGENIRACAGEVEAEAPG